MRCQFCGWENPENRSACEKCNQPLQQVAPIGKSTVRENMDSSAADRKTMTRSNDGFNPKATVRENVQKQERVSECPKCGYNVENEDVCPCCGEVLTVSADKVNASEFKKTVRPEYASRFKHDALKGFRLVKLSNSGQVLDTIQYDDDEVSLNRDNLDAGNQTITSHVQAIIKKDGDKWQITDQSELLSTFVQASRPIEVQNGDLLLIGNQVFRFETE